mgnify:CR=1 FL=1
MGGYKLMEYGLEHFEYQSMKGAGQNLNPGDGWDSGFQSERGVYICRSTVRAVKSFVSAGRLGICSGKKEHSGSITGSCPGRDRSGNDRISGQRRNSCQTSGSNPKVCGKN